MNISQIQQGSSLYNKALVLRHQLFFKEQGLPMEILNDQQEREGIHIAITLKNELVAYGRLAELNNKEFQISQMVVAPAYQGQGYGKKILLKLMHIAQRKGATGMMLNARTTAVGFYQKEGFQEVGAV